MESANSAKCLINAVLSFPVNYSVLACSQTLWKWKSIRWNWHQKETTKNIPTWWKMFFFLTQCMEKANEKFRQSRSPSFIWNREILGQKHHSRFLILKWKSWISKHWLLPSDKLSRSLNKTTYWFKKSTLLTDEWFDWAENWGQHGFLCQGQTFLKRECLLEKTLIKIYVFLQISTTTHIS